MKRIILCFLTIFWMMSLIVFAEAETESIELNHASEQLSAAESSAASHEAQLERFLSLDDASWSAALERGQKLADAVRAARDHTVYQLEGDTSLEDCGPLSGLPGKSFTIDMNGHVLYAPSFAYGWFILRNGTAVDVMTDTVLEHEEGPVKLDVAQDACLLSDRNGGALDLYATGDLTLRNEGLIAGIHRLVYQAARSNKMVFENSGVIYSDAIAISSRAFHQNTKATIRNDGVIVGLVRGLDFHCAGGTLDVKGSGKIIGATGPDLEFPKITFACDVIADDLNLTEEEQTRIETRLNPYGDKDVPTGIGFDLQGNQADFRMNWKVTGEIWASQALVRVAFPQNSNMRGDLSPSVAEMSPSREALIRIELEEAHHELTGDAARKELNEALKTLKFDGLLEAGGQLSLTALSRYAEEDGRSHVRFSVGDTRWSRMLGIREGRNYTWQDAENGSLEAQEPLTSLNDYYQMKACLALAGNGGTVLLDRDVQLPGGENEIGLAQGTELRGDGIHLLGGDVHLVVDRKAALTDVKAETPLCLRSASKADTLLTLQGGSIRELHLDNLMLETEQAEIDTLEMVLWGGKKEYTTPIRKKLRLISTERISGAFRFLMDIGTQFPEEAEIDLTLMKGNQSKTYLFEGTTGADQVTLQVLNDRDPGHAFQPTGKDLLQTCMPYLKVINLKGLRSLDGTRPPLVFRDENHVPLLTFRQLDDGSWELQE